jgi:hypothetical protein
VSTASADLQQTFAADQRQLGQEWLRITIERSRANISKLKIGSTQELYNSFFGEMRSAAGADELRLRLVYAIQGMYVDMGVGRGMGKGVTKNQGADYNALRNSKGKLLRHQRKAKRWYRITREVKALSELYSDLTGNVMLAAIGAWLPSEPVQVDL